MGITLNLSKGESFNLTKAVDKALTQMYVGLRWGKIGGMFGFGSKDVDLDASIFCFDRNGKRRSICYFGDPKLGYLTHSGDDLVGGLQDSDNETIRIDFDKIPEYITKLIVTLNAYDGTKLNKVPNAGIRVYEGAPDAPTTTHVVYDQMNDSSFEGAKSMVVGMMDRTDDGWVFKACGDTYPHARLGGLEPELSRYTR